MAEKTKSELLVSVGELQTRLDAERNRPTVGKVASVLDECMKALDRIKSESNSYGYGATSTARDVEQVIRFLAVRYDVNIVQNHYIPCEREHEGDM